MHQATILCSEGFFGKYDHEDKLKVADVQRMVHASEDEGPFHMTSGEREARRQPKAKQKRIEVLKKELKEKGIVIFNGCNDSFGRRR
jgi:hypothetical protein